MRYPVQITQLAPGEPVVWQGRDVAVRQEATFRTDGDIPQGGLSNVISRVPLVTITDRRMLLTDSDGTPFFGGHGKMHLLIRHQWSFSSTGDGTCAQWYEDRFRQLEEAGRQGRKDRSLEQYLMVSGGWGRVTNCVADVRIVNPFHRVEEPALQVDVSQVTAPSYLEYLRAMQSDAGWLKGKLLGVTLHMTEQGVALGMVDRYVIFTSADLPSFLTPHLFPSGLAAGGPASGAGRASAANPPPCVTLPPSDSRNLRVLGNPRGIYLFDGRGWFARSPDGQMRLVFTWAEIDFGRLTSEKRILHDPSGSQTQVSYYHMLAFIDRSGSTRLLVHLDDQAVEALKSSILPIPVKWG